MTPSAPPFVDLKDVLIVWLGLLVLALAVPYLRQWYDRWTARDDAVAPREPTTTTPHESTTRETATRETTPREPTTTTRDGHWCLVADLGDTSARGCVYVDAPNDCSSKRTFARKLDCLLPTKNQSKSDTSAEEKT